jgi:RimJ/RimL family protein N-acetyltransferase
MARGQRPTPKPRPRKVSGDPFHAAQVSLRLGRGSPQRGGSPGGRYWHIEADGVRAGYVFINIIEDPRLGSHPSIQIQLNTDMRSRAIGREAYRLASEASGYEMVYAHMRKSNVASMRAAIHAGYSEVSGDSSGQLTMVWRRR